MNPVVRLAAEIRRSLDRMRETAPTDDARLAYEHGWMVAELRHVLKVLDAMAERDAEVRQ